MLWVLHSFPHAHGRIVNLLSQRPPPPHLRRRQAFDQIIVTEAANAPPAIDGNLDGLGIRRRVEKTQGGAAFDGKSTCLCVFFPASATFVVRNGVSSTSTWAAAAQETRRTHDPDKLHARFGLISCRTLRQTSIWTAPTPSASGVPPGSLISLVHFGCRRES